MIVALDANSLIVWGSHNEANKLNRARLEHLFVKVAAAKGRIVIPAPAFAEFLVGVDEAAEEWLNGLERKRTVFVAPFDKRSALECSLIDKAAISKGDKKAGRKEPWQRIKVDRQIVSVARVNGATVLVTNDAGLRAAAAGIQVTRIDELDLPDAARQHDLPLEHPSIGSVAPPP